VWVGVHPWAHDVLTSMRTLVDNAHMKQRVNLTLDGKLLARAKALAHQQKTSISRLVEKGLQDLTKVSVGQGRSFADRWMGKLKLVPRNPADPKREYLWRKHGLAGDANSRRH